MRTMNKLTAAQLHLIAVLSYDKRAVLASLLSIGMSFDNAFLIARA